MLGGIHDFEVIFLHIRVQTDFHHLAVIRLVHALVQHHDQIARRLCVQRFHRKRVGDGVHDPGKFVRVFRHQLAPLAVIQFIAVVFGRIVGGGDHYPPGRAEITHRKGKLRRGAQTPENIRLDPVFCQHARRFHTELAAHTPVIVGDDNALFSRVRVVLFQKARIALGRFAHGIPVHPVGSGAQHPAHSRRAKRKVGIKPVADFRRVAADPLQFLSGCRVCRALAAPLFVQLHLVSLGHYASSLTAHYRSRYIITYSCPDFNRKMQIIFGLFCKKRLLFAHMWGDVAENALS